MNCKDCIYFDNTIPVDTIKNEADKHKTAEEYIGYCKKIDRIKMMNDNCPLFKKKEN